MLEKTYQPAEIEPRIHAEWEKADAFKAGRPRAAQGRRPTAIVIPPPNVTGSLHMGHALNNTLQDVLVPLRAHARQGRALAAGHRSRRHRHADGGRAPADASDRSRTGATIGREKFLEKVWAWKEESGGTIVNQLKRLGASCDWSRERFTMDEGLSKAVVKVFVELYNAGLIYKDKRLVNWDPKFQTAISDLEVVQVEAQGHVQLDRGRSGEAVRRRRRSPRCSTSDPTGHMYHFRYPLATKVPGYDKDYIVVATTRPETMLGDTGVAVHPEDERYAALVKAKREGEAAARRARDPDRRRRILRSREGHGRGEDHARARLQRLRGRQAARARADQHARRRTRKLNDDAPEAYRGLDRFEARKRVVADLEALGLLEKIEPTTHTVPHGDRSDVVIEPWLTDQWYVNAAELAKPAIAAVESGKTDFVPKNWEKTYFEWMRNIQPWCISRQLWWGHQIPAWYGPDGACASSRRRDEASAGEALRQRSCGDEIVTAA